MNHKKLRVLSLGAGVQSSTLALLSEKGVIDKPDCAIFADTGWEPKKVYEWLGYLKSKLSYPVHIVQKGNIKEDLIANIETGVRFASVPFFTAGGGMGRRQCTNEYKLTPIKKKAKEILDYPVGKRIPEGSIEMLIGISTDEISRVKPSRVKYIKNMYPLIDLGMSRQDCINWMLENGYGEPPKSSCIGCPYHNNAHWYDMKINQPEEFSDAVKIDKLLRSNGARKGFDNVEYMHPKRIPLDEVNFNKYENQEKSDMFDDECEGMCGV